MKNERERESKREREQEREREMKKDEDRERVEIVRPKHRQGERREINLLPGSIFQSVLTVFSKKRNKEIN